MADGSAGDFSLSDLIKLQLAISTDDDAKRRLGEIQQAMTAQQGQLDANQQAVKDAHELYAKIAQTQADVEAANQALDKRSADLDAEAANLKSAIDSLAAEKATWTGIRDTVNAQQEATATAQSSWDEQLIRRERAVTARELAVAQIDAYAKAMANDAALKINRMRAALDDIDPPPPAAPVSGN